MSLVSPAVATGTPNEGGEGEAIVETTGCSECGQTEGHADTCAHYVPPQPQPEPDPQPVVCGQCGVTDGHKDDCLVYCTCTPVEGKHQEGCKFYVPPVAPQPEPEPEVQPELEQKPDPEVQPEQPPVKDEPKVCDCGTETDFHAKDCALPEEEHVPALVYTQADGVFAEVKHHDDKHLLDLEKDYADATLYVVAGEEYQDLFFQCKLGGLVKKILGDTYFEMKVEAPDADGQLAEVTGVDLTFAMMTAKGHDAVVSLSPAVEPGTVSTLTACELSPEDAAEAIAEEKEVETYTVTIQVIGESELKCEFCGVSLVVEKKNDEVTHKTDCQTNCSCEPVDGVHADTCPLYKSPEQNPEQLPEVIPVACTECGAETGHLETCPQWICAECEKHECECEVILCDQCEATQAEDGTVVHEKNCPQYKLQKGDAFWIKSGSFIYKDYTNANEEPHKLYFSYSVTFEQEIVAEDGTVWYEFKLDSLGDWLIWGYKYVKAENSSVEKPVECTCGTTSDIHNEDCPLYVAPECTCGNPDGPHAENCPLYEAPECTCGNPDGPHAEGCPLYEVPSIGAIVDGATIQVVGAPEGVTLEASEVSEDSYNENVYDNLEDDAEILFAFDITPQYEDGTPWSEGKATVSVDVSSQGLADGNMIGIIHEHNGQLIDLGKVEVVDGKLTFDVDGFSTFYFYIVFEYGGHQFTMSGGSEVYLSEVLKQLGIDRSVREVESVVFSNPAVLEITREGNDWLLTSLESFGSEEVL
ncbi:MAG: hypothetical protein IJE03_05935, partial [Ruminiclostridium sp.]|nr:hypothetical protein [Ruminiclostridium sp.]